MKYGIFCVIALAAVALSANAAPPVNKPGKPGKVQTAPLAQTGQTTSYSPGDDGDLQVGIPSPDPRFIDHQDGTATDMLTGLMWTTDGGQWINYWWDALDYCNSYSAGSLDDWRLPNLKELLSLLDFSQGGPNNELMLPVGHPFTNVMTNYAGIFYWTSTTSPVYGYPSGVYAITMDTGRIEAGWGKTGSGYLLCVRSGS